MSPKPGHNHQFAATRLVVLLEQAAPPGWVVLPEVDLELGIIKPGVLAAAGVSHYWRVDLEAQPYI